MTALSKHKNQTVMEGLDRLIYIIEEEEATAYKSR